MGPLMASKKYAGRSRFNRGRTRASQIPVCATSATPASLASVTPARAGSVNADGLQFVAPCVGNRRFPAVGQPDRRAVGGMQRTKLQSRRDLRRLAKQPPHVFAPDLLNVGDMTLAKVGQRLDRDAFGF